MVLAELGVKLQDAVKRLNLVTVVDEDGSSDVDNVEKILEGLIADGKADAFFTCGSSRLLKLMQVLGKKHDVPGQVAMEQIMDLWEGVRTFPGIRQFDNVTVLEHLEALKDMYPYLQCTTVRKTPVAKCQAQLRARRGCQEWTLKRGTLCAECLKSLFLP